MAKIHYFVEEESGWKDGCYQKLVTWKPVETQEAQLIKQAIELKEVAQAQQKLLDQYRQTITLTPVRTVR